MIWTDLEIFSSEAAFDKEQQLKTAGRLAACFTRI